jgi:hypothetical protein
MSVRKGCFGHTNNRLERLQFILNKYNAWLEYFIWLTRPSTLSKTSASGFRAKNELRADVCNPMESVQTINSSYGLLFMFPLSRTLSKEKNPWDCIPAEILQKSFESNGALIP